MNIESSWNLETNFSFVHFTNENFHWFWSSGWIWSLSDFRLIEADAKSLNSLSGNSGHSRKSSDTSQISLTSGKQRFVSQLRLLYHVYMCVYMVELMICVMVPGTSSSQERIEDGEEDNWTLWGRVSNDWDNYCKKRNSFVRVSCGVTFVAGRVIY